MKDRSCTSSTWRCETPDEPLLTLGGLAATIDKRDVAEFTSCLKEYDSTIKLDEWRTPVLLKMKGALKAKELEGSSWSSICEISKFSSEEAISCQEKATHLFLDIGRLNATRGLYQTTAKCFHYAYERYIKYLLDPGNC
ncbi:hypothetical protein KY289_013695 [Solanum tuberosum]|nr:hypothetical protein KY289_013695 [Solanum tuberosum]